MIVDPKVMRALLEVPYHHKMITLAIWFAWRYPKPIITSGYRSASIHDKDSGIHSTIPCRAIDWRSSQHKNPQKIAWDVNNHWGYDPKRPQLKCAIYHDVGLGAHFHLQVHPNTKFYSKGREKED